MRLCLPLPKVSGPWRDVANTVKEEKHPSTLPLLRCTSLKSFMLTLARFKEDDTAMRFLKNDSEAQDGYKNTKLLSSIAASDYKAIFYVGGHGPGSSHSRIC